MSKMSLYAKNPEPRTRDRLQHGVSKKVDKMTDFEKLQESLAGIVGAQWVSPVKSYLNVRPRTSDEIAKVMEVANETKTPVTPRGGGTGWWSSTRPRAGGIRLSMTRMDEVLVVDEDAMTVTVESGITFTKLESKIGEKGYRIMVFPESGKTAQIGGHIGTWGTSPFTSSVFEDQDTQIVALKVVLPTGEIVQTGSGAVTTAAGSFARRFFPSDLTGLFIGGDGAFGIITEVTLKLHKQPEAIVSRIVGFHDLGSAITVLRKIQEAQRGGGLSTLLGQRLINKEMILPIIPRLDGPLSEMTQVLIVTGYGDTGDVTRHLTKACEISMGEGGKILDDDVPEWWEGRYSNITNHVGASPRVLLVAMIPFGKYLEASDLVEKLGREHGQEIATRGYPFAGIMLGHATIGCENSTPEAREKALSLAREIMEALMNIGCVPHRVGTDFLPVITGKLDPAYYDLIRKIKHVLDPNRIMNPGVVLSA